MIYNIKEEVDNGINPIGTRLFDEKNNISTPATIETNVKGAFVTLTKGVWVINAYWVFNTRSTSNSVNKQVGIFKDGSHYWSQRLFTTANYGALTTSCTIVIEDDETTEFAVYGACSVASGTSKDSCRISAIRVA